MEHYRLFGVIGSGFPVLACLVVAVPSASLEIAPNMHHADVSVFAAQSIKGRANGVCLNDGPQYKAWCGRPLTPKDGPRQLELSTDLVLAKAMGTGICSHYWQDYVLASIFEKIGTTNRYFLECGAKTPHRLNSAHFRLNCGWQGLLLDGAPSASPDVECPDCFESQALLSAPENATVRLRKVNLTRENVNDVLDSARVPHSFDLLTVDIDGREYWILKGLDINRFAPRVVAIKFSSFFSKDQLLVPKNRPKQVLRPNEVNGASLAALDIMMRGQGYSYVAQVAGEHAIWVLRSALSKSDQNGAQIPERVEEGWQATGAEFNAKSYQAPNATDD